mgnify:CR=1 FL=1
MQRSRLILILSVLCLAVMPRIVSAQTISEEARRHMARGQAAVEMAKSPAELEDAIKEFHEASRLAPDWPDPYKHLALIQEKTGKLKEAVASLKQYLRLAPNAPDAAKIQEQIYKLEYKAEQVLTVPEIIDVLVSFRGWEAKNHQGCSTSRKEFYIKREGDDAVKVPTYDVPGMPGEYSVAGSLIMEVTGPVLKYVTTFHNCSMSVFDEKHEKWPDYCFYKIEYEIKVVSKTLVKVTQKQLSGGSGVTTCTFQKK